METAVACNLDTAASASYTSPHSYTATPRRTAPAGTAPPYTAHPTLSGGGIPCQGKRCDSHGLGELAHALSLRLLAQLLQRLPAKHPKHTRQNLHCHLEFGDGEEGADGCSMSSERWSTAFTKGVIHRSSRSFSPYPPRTGLVESTLPRQAVKQEDAPARLGRRPRWPSRACTP